MQTRGWSERWASRLRQEVVSDSLRESRQVGMTMITREELPGSAGDLIGDSVPIIEAGSI